MTPWLMGGTAGVVGEGVRFPDVLSTDDALYNLSFSFIRFEEKC